MLSKAKRPVIVVGRGAMWSGAGDEVRALAARTGALIATTLQAKNWLGDDEYHIGISGTYATKTAIGLLSDSDVVVAVGASLNRYTTHEGLLYPEAQFIHIDPKAHVLLSRGKGADHYVQSDGKAGVAAIMRTFM